MPLRFSIIVPTRNRAALLDRCLTAMGELAYAKTDFEVLVVDDGSAQPLGDLAARHPGLSLQIFRTEGVGPASARNLALRAARGAYAVFTDDDCRASPQWLQAFENAIQKQPGFGFGGRIVDSPENAIYGRASQMLVSFLYDYNDRSNGLRFFCSNNLVFPRAELLAMGALAQASRSGVRSCGDRRAPPDARFPLVSASAIPVRKGCLPVLASPPRGRQCRESHRAVEFLRPDAGLSFRQSRSASGRSHVDIAGYVTSCRGARLLC
jgi:hypothetical protein